MKCTTQQMCKVISRNSEIKKDDLHGEHKLIFAVIFSAVADLCNKKQVRSASVFFQDELFEIYCDLVGLKAEGVRRLLIEAEFLVAQS